MKLSWGQKAIPRMINFPSIILRRRKGRPLIVTNGPLNMMRRRRYENQVLAL
jgi:hypothetical protein